MSAETLMLDVRDDIRCGREPFSRIMKAVSDLGAATELLIIAPFEPVPLYAVLSKQGFDHQSRAMDSGDWEIRFTRRLVGAGEKEQTAFSLADVSSPLPSPPEDEREPLRALQGVIETKGGCEGRVQTTASKLLEVDARGLEPPQPLVKILEAASELPAGAQLNARTDRRPMHLYAQLKERGFTAETHEQSDGSFLTHVRRQ